MPVPCPWPADWVVGDYIFGHYLEDHVFPHLVVTCQDGGWHLYSLRVVAQIAEAGTNALVNPGWVDGGRYQR